MKINDCVPELEELIKFDKTTLSFLRDHCFYYSDLSGLASDASAYYLKLKNCTKTKFQFDSEFLVDLSEHKKGTAHIGANFFLEGSQFEGISYFLAIRDNEPRARLLRKYHFDYTSPSTKRKQPHPIFHLQYAGELSPRLSALDLDCTHLDSWLEVPRLFYTPMTLALLINMILKEFPNRENEKLIETSEWRHLIRKNEDHFLAPYFEKCHSFISNRTNQRLFINDFYYAS